jgi:hypothetical protein
VFRCHADLNGHEQHHDHDYQADGDSIDDNQLSERIGKPEKAKAVPELESSPSDHHQNPRRQSASRASTTSTSNPMQIQYSLLGTLVFTLLCRFI